MTQVPMKRKMFLKKMKVVKFPKSPLKFLKFPKQRRRRRRKVKSQPRQFKDITFLMINQRRLRCWIRKMENYFSKLIGKREKITHNQNQLFSPTVN